MRKLIIATVTATFLGVAGATAAEPSACKGIAEDACHSNAACVWRKAYLAGETLLKDGVSKAKRSIRAHCRKRPGGAAKPNAA